MGKRCNKCQLVILDDTDRCPLCHSVLDSREVEEELPVSMSYPDVFYKVKKFTIFMRILLTLAFITTMVAVFVNYQLGHKKWWSLIVGMGMFFLYAELHLFSNPNAGYLKRINLTLILTLLYLVLIDLVVGFAGWSVNYCLPGALISANIIVIILMIVNRRNWASYMLYQIATILAGFVPILLIRLGLVTKPLLSEVAFLSSVSVFLGTVIIGGGEARTELQRRFHI